MNWDLVSITFLKQKNGRLDVHVRVVLGNRADPSLILICRTNKRPTVLALSATTCAQVAVSPETAMGCRIIRFLQAERDVTVP